MRQARYDECVPRSAGGAAQRATRQGWASKLRSPPSRLRAGAARRCCRPEKRTGPWAERRCRDGGARFARKCGAAAASRISGGATAPQAPPGGAKTGARERGGGPTGACGVTGLRRALRQRRAESEDGLKAESRVGTAGACKRARTQGPEKPRDGVPDAPRGGGPERQKLEEAANPRGQEGAGAEGTPHLPRSLPGHVPGARRLCRARASARRRLQVKQRRDHLTD